jgi:DNA-binding transcriptional LysR family regulator
MDYFAAARAFVSAAELRSFSKAANELAIKTSTVSRYVSELERDLGIALFNRSTRGLVLTEGGRVFLDQVLVALQALDVARDATSSLNRTPQGVLRITMPSAFGHRHVVPHLPRFIERYPEIDLDLVVTDETLNLIDAGIDLAIRIGVLPDSTLMARKLAPHRRIACASHAWLNGIEAIAEPQDLLRCEAIRLALQPDDRWMFTRRDATQGGKPIPIELKGRIRADDSQAALELALAGCGLALLPEWLVGDAVRDARLVHVLPQWEARTGRNEPAIWAVYPPKKIVSSKVRAFVDFYADLLGEPPYWEMHGGR